MKVFVTNIGTEPGAQPVVIPWAMNCEDIDVLLSVSQLLKHARQSVYYKTLSITIDMEA